jgi:hypothetical protein
VTSLERQVVAQSETVFTLFRGIHPSAANLLHHHSANDCLSPFLGIFVELIDWKRARQAGFDRDRTKPVGLLPSRQS